jgi:Omp85 superfamily domain
MMTSVWQRHGALSVAVWLAVAVLTPRLAAQDLATTSRTAVIEQAKAEKAAASRPYEPNKVESAIDRAEDIFLSGRLHWHPFFESAYAGGGFTLGAGYRRFVSDYNTIDLRGSITFSGYKRIEAEFLAPRLFDRRGVLSVIGGWREATSVGFYGIGTGPTSEDDRANYSFTQPYASATLDFWPTRRLFLLRGGLELSQWSQESGGGSAPSVEEVYTPETLPGLGASPTYVHVQGTAGLDTRLSPYYARRGGFYGVTAHRFVDTDDTYSFTKMEYDALHHIPVLRDAWVLSLHARVETTHTGDDEQIPFFMLPALGGGSSLRGFASWRFRDRHSVMWQAEWRVLANRFLDMALFVDAGKVTADIGDLNNFHDMKKDYGLGFRLHSPVATPLRIELAKSNEGLAIVFSSKASF